MRIRLPEEWADFLVYLPESGMGYQRVDIRFNDGSIQRDCVVFNAEEVELTESCEGKTIVDVKLHEEGHPTSH